MSRELTQAGASLGRLSKMQDIRGLLEWVSLPWPQRVLHGQGQQERNCSIQWGVSHSRATWKIQDSIQEQKTRLVEWHDRTPWVPWERRSLAEQFASHCVHSQAPDKENAPVSTESLMPRQLKPTWLVKLTIHHPWLQKRYETKAWSIRACHSLVAAAGWMMSSWLWERTPAEVCIECDSIKKSFSVGASEELDCTSGLCWTPHHHHGETDCQIGADKESAESK